MKPRTRTISGAILMLAIIPAIIGLLACSPARLYAGAHRRPGAEPN